MGEPRDGMPWVNHWGGGRGVTAQREGDAGRGGPAIPGMQECEPLTGERLMPWFAAISQGLARVIVLDRSWESALTDSVLQQTPSSPKPEVGVFLDPPYRTIGKDGGKRSTGLYQGDASGASDDVVAASYKWAVEHGAKYRVAYGMHAGDFPIPPGWTVETMGFSGHRDAAKKETAVDMRDVQPAVRAGGGGPAGGVRLVKCHRCSEPRGLQWIHDRWVCWRCRRVLVRALVRLLEPCG